MKIQDVAVLLVEHAEYEITHKELQKLLYLAQGFYLAKYDQPLFEDELEAWQYGPVNQSIWHKYKGFGFRPISKGGSLPNVEHAKIIFISSLLAVFLCLGQQKLIDFSHVDTPWAGNYISSANKLLPKDELKQYFSNFSSFEEYVHINNEKLDFSRLIKERKNYLDDLPDIRDDWISGRSVAPNRSVVDLMGSILSDLEKVLFTKYPKPDYPSLVMGPIPTGGVGIDLKKGDKALYIHLHNNGLVEVATESPEGEFVEDELMAEEFANEVGFYLGDFC